MMHAVCTVLNWSLPLCVSSVLAYRWGKGGRSVWLWHNGNGSSFSVRVCVCVCNMLALELRPVLQSSTRILDLPLARKMWPPRALSLNLPVTSSTLLHPVTSDPHCCSWFRGAAAPSRTSHTHTPPSVEPLNTRGPWDCGDRGDHCLRGLKKHYCKNNRRSRVQILALLSLSLLGHLSMALTC